jgi:hypothetical protein
LLKPDWPKSGISGVVQIQPAVVDHYRTIVRNLRAKLSERLHEKKYEVVASIRNLVEKVVIYPNDDSQGRDLELIGQLAAMLDTASPHNSMRRVVAEERTHLYRTVLFYQA